MPPQTPAYAPGGPFNISAALTNGAVPPFAFTLEMGDAT